MNDDYLRDDGRVNAMSRASIIIGITKAWRERRAPAHRNGIIGR